MPPSFNLHHPALLALVSLTTAGAVLGAAAGGIGAGAAAPPPWLLTGLLVLALAGISLLAAIAWTGIKAAADPTARDQQLQAEQAKVYSEDLLRNIIDHVPYMIFARDQHRRMMFANPALAAHYGETVSSLVARGQNLNDPLISDDPLLCGHDLATAADGTLWHTGGTGSSRRLQVNRISFPQPDGGTGELVVAFDVTDERHLEEQLRHAQKLETIGTLAGGIAHDFNNLLTPIMGYAALMLDDAEQPKTRERLDAIAKAARRGRDLVQQILTFSRQSDALDVEVVSLPVLCKDTIQLLQATLPRTIEITADLPDDTWLVLGDAGQLQQVLINLGTNATQACNGQGQIKISLANLPPANSSDNTDKVRQGPAVRLRVADNGSGMTAEIAARIFEPFFTTKEVGSGTGLGLSVVHGIITGHGGSISVSSEPDAGSCFDLVLPADPAAVLAQATSLPQPEVRSGHVLLVDDEVSVRNVMTLMLERLGYQVTACTDPVEALAAFQADSRRFDVVVTDNSMPHMNGYQLATALRAHDPGVPVVLCSGLIDASSDVSGVIDTFVMKPVSGRHLAQAIHQVTRGRHPDQTP